MFLTGLFAPRQGQAYREEQRRRRRSYYDLGTPGAENGIGMVQHYRAKTPDSFTYSQPLPHSRLLDQHDRDHAHLTLFQVTTCWIWWLAVVKTEIWRAISCLPARIVVLDLRFGLRHLVISGTTVIFVHTTSLIPPYSVYDTITPFLFLHV